MASTDERVNFIAAFELRGDRQVERSTEAITRSILNAKDGAEVAGVAFEKLGRIFEIGLPFGILASSAGILIDKLGKITEEAEKAQEALSKVLNAPSSGTSTSSQLEEKLKKLEELQTERAPKADQSGGPINLFRDTFEEAAKGIAGYFGIDSKTSADREKARQDNLIQLQIVATKRQLDTAKQQEAAIKTSEKAQKDTAAFLKDMAEASKASYELLRSGAIETFKNVAKYQNEQDHPETSGESDSVKKLQADIAQESTATKISKIVAAHSREIGGGGGMFGGRIFNPQAKELQSNTKALQELTQKLNTTKSGGLMQDGPAAATTYLY